MELASLTSLVLSYQDTSLGLVEILHRLAPRIYGYPNGKYGMDEDDCGEFYLFFHPRLLRLLARFKDQGKPFEWYLNSVLHWQYKLYSAGKRRSEFYWTTAKRLELWQPPEPAGAASEPERIEPGCQKLIPFNREGRPCRSSDRRRLLLLALKNACSLDDAGIPRLSRLIGVEEEQLAAMIGRLRAKRYRQEVRLHGMYARRNRAYGKIMLLSQQLHQELDCAKKAELALRLDRLRASLRAVQERIRRVNLNPSNREIAELLRLPKGTVDTSLFLLRRRLTGGRSVRQIEGPERLFA